MKNVQLSKKVHKIILRDFLTFLALFSIYLFIYFCFAETIRDVQNALFIPQVWFMAPERTVTSNGSLLTPPLFLRHFSSLFQVTEEKK